MLVESIAILAIFCIMIFIFLRAGKKTYAISTAPLLVVPFFQVAAKLLGEVRGAKITTDVQSIILIVGLAIGVVLIGVASSAIKGRRSKIIYLSICGGFTTLLTIIFLYNNYIT